MFFRFAVFCKRHLRLSGFSKLTRIAPPVFTAMKSVSKSNELIIRFRRVQSAHVLNYPLAPFPATLNHLKRCPCKLNGSKVLLLVVYADSRKASGYELRLEFTFNGYSHCLISVHIIQQPTVAVCVAVLIEKARNAGGVDSVLFNVKDCVAHVVCCFVVVVVR